MISSPIIDEVERIGRDPNIAGKSSGYHACNVIIELHAVSFRHAWSGWSIAEALARCGSCRERVGGMSNDHHWA